MGLGICSWVGGELGPSSETPESWEVWEELMNGVGPRGSRGRKSLEEEGRGCRFPSSPSP